MTPDMSHMEGGEHYLNMSSPLLIEFESEGALKFFEQKDDLLN